MFRVSPDLLLGGIGLSIVAILASFMVGNLVGVLVLGIVGVALTLVALFVAGPTVAQEVAQPDPKVGPRNG